MPIAKDDRERPVDARERPIDNINLIKEKNVKKKFFSVFFALVLVLSFSLVTAVPAAANTDRLVPSQYDTIQAAIDAAEPGDTIIVAAGTYQENVVVDRSLTLQGENRDTTEIKFGHDINDWRAKPPLTIFANDVTVSGFTISSGPYIEPAWTIVVEGDFALLTDLHVIKAPLLDEINRTRIGGAAILLGTPVGGSGVGGVDSFTFTDSIVDSARNGIYAPRNPGSSNIVVRNVDFTYPSEYAILLMMVTGAIIEGNTFTCTADQYGVTVTRGSSGIGIADNQFIGSGSLAGSHTGILLQAYAEGTMGDVTILSNGISGFNTGISVEDVDTSGISIHYNNITGNAAYGVNYLGSDTVDATKNWWGDASGPRGGVSDPVTGTPANGDGDKVSGNVRFDPWLKAPCTLMSSFTIDHAKIDFKKKVDDDKIRVQGKLELDLVNGGGVAISEAVTVTVGPLPQTITMVEKGKKDDRWHYQRPKGDEGNIKHMTINWKNGKFDIRMDKADLTGITNPVTISVQIGDDVGEKTILMREKKHHWDYKAK